MCKPALSVYVCVRVLAAGNAFCQAARLHMQLQNKLDSATSFVDAGNAYKKADPQGEKRRPCSTVIPEAHVNVGCCFPPQRPSAA